ncbi:hypothetical protein PoB_007293500 [Plakobranchus ocellatus]|uniref:Uncharacterized protein n=1 Tax=Plakobranchus ocellatus TaxID=259542 RepID=A0AAV4DR70_9GAST|nr:hypothetical protein PoB_007293500 [Plakobranchus ocellatus]
MISTVLYGFETWTPTAVLQRKAQAFENKCMKKVWFLCIACPQQGDNMLSGPLSGQGVSGGAQSHVKRVPADLRTNSLFTAPPMPQMHEEAHLKIQKAISRLYKNLI